MPKSKLTQDVVRDKIVLESEVAQMRISSLEEALKRIKELEKEVSNLKAENEKLRNRNLGGRKKHDEAWKSAYNDFIMKYESGMTIMEIVAKGDVSRRTAYRYLAYYKESQEIIGDSEKLRNEMGGVMGIVS